VRRRVLLVITLAFIAALGVLTVDDFVDYGVTPLGVISVLILVFFSIAIVGALWAPRP
jgi:hypothetical protein